MNKEEIITNITKTEEKLFKISDEVIKEPLIPRESVNKIIDTSIFVLSAIKRELKNLDEEAVKRSDYLRFCEFILKKDVFKEYKTFLTFCVDEYLTKS